MKEHLGGMRPRVLPDDALTLTKSNGRPAAVGAFPAGPSSLTARLPDVVEIYRSTPYLTPPASNGRAESVICLTSPATPIIGEGSVDTQNDYIGLHTGPSTISSPYLASGSQQSPTMR